MSKLYRHKRAAHAPDVRPEQYGHGSLRFLQRELCCPTCTSSHVQKRLPIMWGLCHSITCGLVLIAMIDRLCLVCKSLDRVEDEQHFVFDCPAYGHIMIRSQHSNLDLLQHCCTIADFMTLCEPNTCGGFPRECFAFRKQILSV